MHWWKFSSVFVKGPSHYVYVGSFRCHLCTEYPWELICSSIEPPSLSCKILNIVAQEYLCARFMFVGASEVSPLLFLLVIWLYPKHRLENFTALSQSHISEFHCAAPIEGKISFGISCHFVRIFRESLESFWNLWNLSGIFGIFRIFQNLWNL